MVVPYTTATATGTGTRAVEASVSKSDRLFLKYDNMYNYTYVTVILCSLNDLLGSVWHSERDGGMHVTTARGEPGRELGRESHCQCHWQSESPLEGLSTHCTTFNIWRYSSRRRSEDSRDREIEST